MDAPVENSCYCGGMLPLITDILGATRKWMALAQFWVDTHKITVVLNFEGGLILYFILFFRKKSWITTKARTVEWLNPVKVEQELDGRNMFGLWN